jgi:hypothetical protein
MDNASRDPHGYGFTRGFVATGPTVMGTVPDFDTRMQTVPVAMMLWYTVSNTLSSNTFGFNHSRHSWIQDTPPIGYNPPRIWPRNKRSHGVDLCHVIANNFQWKSLSPTSSMLQHLALPMTLSLASILNCFLSAHVVSLAKLQLVGMFLAAKEEEIVAPSAMNFLHCADSSYTEAEILQARKYILKTLEWNMNYPNLILR